jgi:hypothetical protein
VTGNLKPQTGLVAQLTAERDALYDALERLVADRKGIEFSTPKQQASMRNAKALLAEVQRSVKWGTPL